MDGRFSRTERLLGRDNIEKLSNARVAVFGVGGVGGYVAEALARSGIGHFVLIDDDSVALSNLNRQIIALESTIGRNKVDVMKERILEINPAAVVDAKKCFFLPENASEFDFKSYSYVVDAVDTVTAKLSIIEEAKKAGVPVISSMGTGNKLDPTRLEVADIYETSICPLARVMRRECKKRGIESLKVVYSKEEPIRASYGSPSNDEQKELSEHDKKRRSIPGSTAFVPPAAGLIIASEVVKDIIGGAAQESHQY